MGFMWGVALGNGVSTGIKTYGDLLQLKQETQQFNDQQAERQASQNAGSDTNTGVTGSSGQGSQQVLQGIQGGAATQDPEAAMQGLIGVKTANTPEQAASAMQNAQQMQVDSSNANPATISVPAPQQPTPSPQALAAASGIGPSQGTSTGAPTGQMTTPTPAGSIAKAIGGQESNSNPNAPTSVDNAHGPMQITPGTFHAFAKPGENINNPNDNQAVGDRIIAHYTQQYNGDPKKVAVAYFSGPGNVNNDPNAKTPYIHDYKDGNGKSTSSYVADVTRRLGYASKVNSFGNQSQGAASANPTGDTGGVTPDTKITQLTAKQLPVGIGQDQSYQFSQGPNGIQMQKTVTASQRAMAAANVAWQRGDMKNAGALTNAAMNLQSQEMQTKVNAVMNNANLSQDEKVAQLGQLSGSKVFKTENGSYIVPGLGPNDQNGNPAPMSYQQVASMATWMTTPEGMHYAMEYNIQNRQANTAAQQANTAQRSQAVNEANVGSEIHLRNAEADYYGTFKNAQAENQQAQAAQRNSEADINAQKQALGKQLDQAAADVQAGKMTPDQYKVVRQTIMDKANFLDTRMGGGAGGGTQKPYVPEKLEPGQMYRQEDGSVKTLNQTTGQMMDPQASQLLDTNAATIKGSPRFLGYQVDKNSGMVTLPPDQAMKAGLNPKQLYETPQAAYTAYITSPKMNVGNNGLSSTGSQGTGGIGDSGSFATPSAPY